MVAIKSFKAIRPYPQFAEEVASLPYDVMNRDEAKILADNKPHSFLRVTRSEIELSCEDVYADVVYEHAKENLDKFLKQNILFQDTDEHLFVYRLIMQGRSQIGLVALSSVMDYKNGIIKIHEKTRVNKVNDRTKHILSTEAQTGLVFLTFRDSLHITEMLLKETSSAPIYDFTAEDGIQHTVWLVQNNTSFIDKFSQIPNTYIADGHHRAASSVNCFDTLNDKNSSLNEPSKYFLSVIFPDNQLMIMPYNRIIRHSELTSDEILQKLALVTKITPTDSPTPSSKNQANMYLAGRWYNILLPLPTDTTNLVKSLDVSILYDLILAPIFHIGNERTDSNIDFIGGIRGTNELERLVNFGQACCAFSMYPVTIADLLNIADQGLTMAPKSTWFEPKLRSGLFIHSIKTEIKSA